MISKDMYDVLSCLAKECPVRYKDAPDLLGFMDEGQAVAWLQQAAPYVQFGNGRCVITEEGKAAIEEYERMTQTEERAKRAEARSWTSLVISAISMIVTIIALAISSCSTLSKNQLEQRSLPQEQKLQQQESLRD